VQCDTNQLLSTAGCFTCLPRGFFLPLKLVLLSQILAAKGATVPDIATLLAQGQCFACLSQGEIMAVKLQLLCNILGGNVLYTGSNDSQNTVVFTDIIITA